MNLIKVLVILDWRMLIRSSGTLLFACLSVKPCLPSLKCRLLVSAADSLFLFLHLILRISAPAWSLMLTSCWLNLTFMLYLTFRTSCQTTFLSLFFLPQSFPRSPSPLSWADRNQMARLTMSYPNLPVHPPGFNYGSTLWDFSKRAGCSPLQPASGGGERNRRTHNEHHGKWSLAQLLCGHSTYRVCVGKWTCTVLWKHCFFSFAAVERGFFRFFTNMYSLHTFNWPFMDACLFVEQWMDSTISKQLFKSKTKKSWLYWRRKYTSSVPREKIQFFKPFFFF